MVVAVPPKRTVPIRSIVTAKGSHMRNEEIEGIVLTHPQRALWPGISKHDLVEYWRTVAPYALEGLVKRPLAIVRCPEGVDGEHFFQKHAHGKMPAGIREGSADKAPFLVIDGLQGLIAMAQISAIELHVWGATEADPLHPDFLVFDLDPGEGVGTPDLVAAALDIRERLGAIGLESFCRTSGGKGLHLVVPIAATQSWDSARSFCTNFAEALSTSKPDKYLAHVKIADRRGRILIDWLRNGLGSTAVATFSPRARPNAGVATPLAWREVTSSLDPTAFTLATVPGRLQRISRDPWEGFDGARRALPVPAASGGSTEREVEAGARNGIVTAKAPKPRPRGTVHAA
jgi:bifunctional non-homologous end joining protein LigD